MVLNVPHIHSLFISPRCMFYTIVHMHTFAQINTQKRKNFMYKIFNEQKLTRICIGIRRIRDVARKVWAPPPPPKKKFEPCSRCGSKFFRGGGVLRPCWLRPCVESQCHVITHQIFYFYGVPKMMICAVILHN